MDWWIGVGVEIIGNDGMVEAASVAFSLCSFFSIMVIITNIIIIIIATIIIYLSSSSP
jgi:hypothetical protein